MSRRVLLLGCALMASAGCGTGAATIVHDGGSLSGQNYWEAGVHVVNGDITVYGTLSVAAGATIKMGSGVNFIITQGGSLSLNGTAAKPVNIQPQSDGGAWGSIEIDHTAADTSGIDYAVLTGGGASNGVIYLSDAQLSLANTTVSGATTYGLEMLGYSMLNGFTGNTFKGNKYGPVSSEADSVAALNGSGNTFDNVIYVVSSTLHQDDSWSNLGQPYLIDQLAISSGLDTQTALLSVSAGVTFMMAPHGSISIDQSVTGNGGVYFAGTQTQGITITSSSAQPAAGDWSTILFAGAGSYDEATQISSFIQYTTITFGGGHNANDVAQAGAVQVLANGSVNITNSEISYSFSDGLSLIDGGYAVNSAKSTLTFTDNAGVAVDITPDALDYLLAGGVNITSTVGDAIVLVEPGALAGNANWNALANPNSAIVISGNITAAGYTLNINAGTTLYLATNKSIDFTGQSHLYLNGTQSAPVIISAVDPTQPWDAITISGDSTFNYAQISWGGGNGDYGQVLAASGYLYMYNTTFSNSTARNNTQSGHACDYAIGVGANTGIGNTVTGTQC